MSKVIAGIVGTILSTGVGILVFEGLSKLTELTMNSTYASIGGFVLLLAVLYNAILIIEIIKR